MADLTKLVDELSSLTVLEAAELARKATEPEKTDGSARFSWGSGLRKQ